jgi:hypothetical protein
MIIINEMNFYIIYKREWQRPAALHCCSCKCLLAAILANLCQLFAENAAKTDSSW